MADFKKNMTRGMQSARHWLMRAEEAFGKNRDVRGELDLMIAQAELQRVREANRAGQWRFKYPLLWQGLAFGFAAMIAVAGLGGTYLWLRDKGNVAPVPLAAIEKAKPVVPAPAAVSKPAPAKIGQPDSSLTPPSPAPVAVTEPSPAPAAISTPNSQSSLQETRPPQTVTRSHTASPEVVLPPQEMQKLIREAGRSLRGQ
ncbi:Hypothetical protein LUCI_4546 [Lucifera butyrica]|uniref:Uncharacterized protein n=1 Tax=Lucifera butyrica TaxID=1351585 RepID=A0A498R966_9FIRM|nr:hypothetical protein [Lucifera butyrica]VBB09256.1 Hypothetical protein LUCI_4546 [Lucifera butyrica]